MRSGQNCFRESRNYDTWTASERRGTLRVMEAAGRPLLCPRARPVIQGAVANGCALAVRSVVGFPQLVGQIAVASEEQAII